MRTLGDLVRDARELLNDPTPSWSGPAPAPYFGVTYSATLTVRQLQHVIGEARGLLNDTEPLAYRYPEADLYIYLSDALMYARRFRPDLFERVPGPLPQYTPAMAATFFPLDETYFPNFVQYVVASAEMRDDTTAQEAETAKLAEGFMANLQSAPYRYSDAFLYGLATDAVYEARRLRPDLFHGQMRLPGPAYAPADGATPFPLDARWYTHAVDYVVAAAKARNKDSPAPSKQPAPPDGTETFAKRLVAA